MPPDPDATKGGVLTAAMSIDAGSGAVRDADRLTAALHELLAASYRRKELQDTVTIDLQHNEAVLGRWAAVVLNADVYAELIDRHVELAGDLAWLSSLLGFEFVDHDGRADNGPNHPPGLIEGQPDDDLLAQRLAASRNSPSSSTAARSTSPYESSPSNGAANNGGLLAALPFSRLLAKIRTGG